MLVLVPSVDCSVCPTAALGSTLPVAGCSHSSSRDLPINLRGCRQHMGGHGCGESWAVMRRLGETGPADQARRVWLLGGGLALASAGAWAAWLRQLDAAPAPRALPGWLLAGLFCLAEILVVHLQLRRDAHSRPSSPCSCSAGWPSRARSGPWPGGPCSWPCRPATWPCQPRSRVRCDCRATRCRRPP